MKTFTICNRHEILLGSLYQGGRYGGEYSMNVRNEEYMHKLHQEN